MWTRKKVEHSSVNEDIAETPESQNDEAKAKSFKIIGCEPPYQPILKKAPAFDLEPSLSSESPQLCSKSYRLYLKHEAISQIFEHIGWGKKIRDNQVEQGGILLGNVFNDVYNQFIYGIVEQTIPAKLAKGYSAYLRMDHITWKEMIDSVDALIMTQSQSYQIIGWYHTHPNEIPVFMSGTDRGTQRVIFGREWQFAIVLNPHRKIWRVFQGHESMECSGSVIVQTGLDDRQF